jgi:hypothetical protein
VPPTSTPMSQLTAAFPDFYTTSIIVHARIA